ncbi:ankyrin repeat domain-containing protein [Fimbriimonas ginsengisoli]|uniref:Ankyrin n=1 Tax=Fimbriimonas ginsengisoli Gsoil 348 TaxID=661478 RepID=A0A068NVJ7_FIMGI|nr:ankyrin repeat domain-containing protein [Fimbriimonas ginsengisoli]AIE86815.1 Ankyrin [Fimbriimonas ginsengisoli Gsoil 348]
MNHLIFAVLLLSFGQRVAKQPPLIEAIQKHDLALATRLLKDGANPNSREIITTKPSATDGIVGGTTREGDTALELAVDRQSVTFVNLLLHYKADPNTRGQAEWTPLMTACQRSSVEIVRILLRNGAKPNLRNRYGDTAIIFAANVDRVEMVNELVGAGADMNGGTGQTALMIAAECDSTKTVKYLLKHGADPNFRRPGHWTPLEFAIERNSTECAEMLKKAGAKGRSRAQLRKEVDAEVDLAKKQHAFEQKAQVAMHLVVKPDAVDSAVIEAAVIDVATFQSKEFDPFFGVKAKSIILVEESAIWNDFIESQMNGELSEEQACDIDLSMRRSLQSRNARLVSLAGCKFRDPRIVQKRNKALPNDMNPSNYWQSKYKGWVQVMLPGYSTDGAQAVLRFWFGPTPHGAAATYFLRKVAGKWTVVWRDLARYV